MYGLRTPTLVPTGISLMITSSRECPRMTGIYPLPQAIVSTLSPSAIPTTPSAAIILTTASPERRNRRPYSLSIISYRKIQIPRPPSALSPPRPSPPRPTSCVFLPSAAPSNGKTGAPLPPTGNTAYSISSTSKMQPAISARWISPCRLLFPRMLHCSRVSRMPCSVATVIRRSHSCSMASPRLFSPRSSRRGCRYIATR